MPGLGLVGLFIVSVFWGAGDVILDQSKIDYQQSQIVQDR